MRVKTLEDQYKEYVKSHDGQAYNCMSFQEWKVLIRGAKR